MTRRLRLASVILGAVLLQTTLFTHLRIDGVGPEVGLVCAIAVAYEDGADRGAIFGFVMGLAMDLFSPTPLGLLAMTYAITAYGVGVFQQGIVRSSPWIAPVLGGVGGVFGGLVFVSVGALVGEEGFLSMASLKTVLIAALFDALIAPVLFPVVRRAARDSGGGAAREWTALRARRKL